MTSILQTNFETKNINDLQYALISLEGQIDEDNLREFDEFVDPITKSNHNYLVFSLENLEFINSKVIGYLAAMHIRLTENKKQMIFMKTNPEIFDILELVGLTQIIPVFDTETKMVEAIKNEEI